MIYPVWTARNGDVIVNEMCACGMLRTEHGDNHPVFAQGHGACFASGCKRFTYKRFVIRKAKAVKKTSKAA